jgi:hypothetical protein
LIDPVTPLANAIKQQTDLKKNETVQHTVGASMAATIRLEPNTASKTFQLLFKTDEIIALSVFHGQDALYVVCDKKYTIVLPDAPFEALYSSIDVIDNQKVSVIKITLNPFITVGIERVNGSLALEFLYRDSSSYAFLLPTPSLMTVEQREWPETLVKPVSSDGNEVFLSLDGILYYVYMTTSPDGGNKLFYRNTFYEIIPTVQGVVVRYFSGQTIFKNSLNQLIIQHKVNPTDLKGSTDPGTFQNLFDCAEERDLQKELARLNEKMAPPSSRESIPLNLQKVWLHLSLKQGHEARGMLDMLAVNNPSVIYHPLFRAYLGMAFFLESNYEKALEQWRLLPDTCETITWKGLAEAAQGDFSRPENYIITLIKTLQKK